MFSENVEVDVIDRIHEDFDRAGEELLENNSNYCDRCSIYLGEEEREIN